MPILPQLKDMFMAQQNSPPFPADLPPATLRAQMHAIMEQSFYSLAAPREKLPVERDIAVAVPGGEITLRLYRDASGSVLPCHVYTHGGAFFLGTLDHSDGGCRMLASGVGCAVVSVDYRLAPEHKFPTPPEDCYAALCWVAAHAAELGIDPARISVGGASAGGDLAAVVAQMARDRGGPAIIAQVLEIPVLDFTAARDLDFPEEGIHIGAQKSYMPIYLRDAAQASDPLASPLLAEDLRGLPPALVTCMEYDQLQPEAEAYAKRLTEAGVPTVYRCWPGHFHGSQMLDLVIPEEVAGYEAEVVGFLKKAYAAMA